MGLSSIPKNVDIKAPLMSLSNLCAKQNTRNEFSYFNLIACKNEKKMCNESSHTLRTGKVPTVSTSIIVSVSIKMSLDFGHTYTLYTPTPPPITT